MFKKITAIICSVIMTMSATLAFAEDSAVVFYNSASNYEISGLDDIENLYAKTEFVADYSGEAKVITARYDSTGTLLDTVIEPKTLVKDQTAEITTSSVSTKGADKIKVVVWDMTKGIRPLVDFGEILTGPNNEKIPVQKFEAVFENTDDYLYRVGNLNTVSLSSLFKASDGAVIESETVNVDIEAVDATTTVSGTFAKNQTSWADGKITFSGTGPVKVTISDEDACIPTELYLEVINAKNITKADSATANDVVLLNDISGTFTASGGHTFHGNGFTVTLPTSSVTQTGNGFTGYISLGGVADDGSGSGGNLDNVRIVGPVYPEMYIYRDQAKITDTSDPDYGDGNNMRYFKNSVVVYGGDSTISNSYISGSRTALCVRAANNVVIENTTLSGGVYANMQICTGSSVTLRDLTTVQTDVPDSYGQGKTMHGLGIAVDSNVVDIYIEGELKQYNWICEEQFNTYVPSSYQSAFPKFFTNSTFSKYWHYLNGGTDPYVNIAFIFACDWDTSKIHDNRETVDYETCSATIAGVSGGVYSKVNTSGNTITDSDLQAPDYASSGFNPVAPVFAFDNTANYDADDEADEFDSYCIYETGTLKVGITEDSKVIDLSGVSVKKNGVDIPFTAYFNGNEVLGNTVTVTPDDGTTQTLKFSATVDSLGFDVNGNPVDGEKVYNWTVPINVATLSYPAPVWNMNDTYTFDTSNCYYAYYLATQGYGEAVPVYEGIKINYYNANGELVELDLSGTTTLPTGSGNSNSNAFTYTLSDGSTLTMKYASGWKSGATTHQFTAYNSKAYIYPQSLNNDNYVRAKVINQDFDVKLSYTFTDPHGQKTDTKTMRWYNAAASNGNVSTVQWKTFDSTNGKAPSCVTPETLITLADGSYKRIDELTYDDKLLVWDFYNGEYTIVSPMIIDDHGYGENTVIKLTFDDGTEVKAVNLHQFFDADLNKLVNIDGDSVSEYLNHSFVKRDADGYKTVKLVDYEISEEYVKAYGVLSAAHYNILVNDMFSADYPPGTYGLMTYFEVGDNLTYDKEKMQADIEKYGLYSYEDFADYMTLEEFNAMNMKYMKISVGKGYYTYEGIISLIETYLR